MPGTTRDSIYIPMERDGREYVLIDTAGVRKRGKITDAVEKFSVIKTLQAIEDANVVMLVIDAREGISDQDLSLLGFILNSGRSLVIVVNKWDGLSQEVKEQVKETLDFRLGFIDFARVHFISALHGSGVGNLFESVREAYDSSTRRVGTSMLTRIMTMAVEDHQPPLVRGRRVKLKYAHAGGYNPPIVVIHGNQVKDLPDSYKRYLMNYFRKSLDVMGSPIRIQFKEGENPYANKRNTLTPTQMRKRKRLMKHIKKSKSLCNRVSVPTPTPLASTLPYSKSGFRRLNERGSGCAVSSACVGWMLSLSIKRTWMYSSSTRRACSSSLPLMFRLQLSLNKVPVPISASELFASAFAFWRWLIKVISLCHWLHCSLSSHAGRA